MAVFLNPSPLRRPAPVVRDRRYILDSNDFEARGLNRPDSRLAARTRTFYIYLNLSHAVLHGLLRSRLCSQLRCEGRTFSRSLESLIAGARPGNHVSCRISDGHDRIIE